MAANTYTITITEGNPRISVRTSAGVAYTTTPYALGTHLLASAGQEEASTQRNWHDFLFSHGVAVSQVGNRVATFATIPAKERSVGRSVLKFPPILAGMLTNGGVFQRAVLYLYDPTKQANLSVTSRDLVLQGLPYGNVYENGRICWGTVSPRGITSIQQLDETFFSTGFNSDLIACSLPGGVRALTEVANGSVLPTPNRWNHSVQQAVRLLLANHE